MNLEAFVKEVKAGKVLAPHGALVAARVLVEGAAPVPATAEDITAEAYNQDVIDPDDVPWDNALAQVRALLADVAKAGPRKRLLPAKALRARQHLDAPAVRAAEAKLAAHLKTFLRAQAGKVAAQLGARLELKKAAGDEDSTASEDTLDQQRAVVSDALKQLDLQGWTVLINPTREILQSVGEYGGRETLATLGVEDQTIFDRANTGAIDFAKQRAAALVGKRVLPDGRIIDSPNPEYAITDSTRDLIREDVTRAFTDGVTRYDLATMLQENYAFSEQRAEMIAQTEITHALAAANMAAWDEGGVTGKQWLLSDDHPERDECDDNAEAGIIPLDQPFPSGDQEPGAHPRCFCDVTSADLPGAEE